MKRIFLILTLGMFLGAASVSAAEITTAHKAKTEQKENKSGKQKKAHKKGHKKGNKKNTSNSKAAKS